MEIGRIQGCTRVLGKSQGYYGLPIRDELSNDSVTGPNTPVMVTAWFPTPDELAALNAGAAVHLRVVGTAHPPVMLGVGEVPELSRPQPDTAPIFALIDQLEASFDNLSFTTKGPDAVRRKLAELRKLVGELGARQ